MVKYDAYLYLIIKAKEFLPIFGDSTFHQNYKVCHGLVKKYPVTFSARFPFVHPCPGFVKKVHPPTMIGN
jgi:hypothetical protein